MKEKNIEGTAKYLSFDERSKSKTNQKNINKQ